MSAPFLLRVRGRGGHAAMPGIADNALVKAAPLVELLSDVRAGARARARGRRRSSRRSRTARRRRLERRSTARALDLAARGRAGRAAARHDGRADDGGRVVAAERDPVELRDHGRLAACCPASIPKRCSNDVRAFLGDGDYELEPIERRGGTRSPASGPLWDAVAAFVAEDEPAARVVPFCTAGFTDSHWMRTAFGAVAYGFYPSRFDPETAARLIHSADERVPVDDLELGVRYLRFMARAICS